VAINNADYLWQELATPLESHTKGFADELPQAKESGLGTLRIGLRSLIISTKAYPLLTFELQLDPQSPCVNWELSEQASAKSQLRVQTGRIGFATDRNLQPCFMDGDRLLAPSVLAEELMEKVAASFQRASQLSSLLA